MIKNVVIDFIPVKSVDEQFYPIPAIKNIPEWYKEQKNFLPSNEKKIINGVGNFTIKKCMPVFDALTAGYILFTHTDIYVEFSQNGQKFSTPQNANAAGIIDFHENEQAENHPNSNMMMYPKFSNPWVIKTSSGYSTLFIPPMHNPNGIFSILPGIVDTDKYYNPVNLPFVLNDPTFTGIIPAGTQICQIIPFKRSSFKMKISEDEKSINYANKFFQKYNVKFFNNYKNRYWEKKYYR